MKPAAKQAYFVLTCSFCLHELARTGVSHKAGELHSAATSSRLKLWRYSNTGKLWAGCDVIGPIKADYTQACKVPNNRTHIMIKTFRYRLVNFRYLNNNFLKNLQFSQKTGLEIKVAAPQSSNPSCVFSSPSGFVVAPLSSSRLFACCNMCERGYDFTTSASPSLVKIPHCLFTGVGLSLCVL